MSHPDGHDSTLDQLTWRATLDRNLDKKDLLLHMLAEQQFVVAQLRARNMDHRDYLLALIDSASAVSEGAGQPSPFDAHRMRRVITEAAARGHWGKAGERGRTQGIAAHYDAQGCAAIVVDIEMSDERRLIVHHAVVVADLGHVESPGRVRSQLEGAWLMGVALVTSCDIGPAMGNRCAILANRASWPLVPWLPGEIAVHLINPTGAVNVGQPSQVSHVPVVRALCSAICQGPDNRASDARLSSQVLEKAGER
ncbi:molybdopterin-dependent oxidoreductase [Pseudomonas sp. R4-84]